ncbi:MAG: DUF559 domain-containing protein [Dehalococcoidia bacterium]
MAEKKPSAKRSAEDQFAAILTMADAPLSHFNREYQYVPGRKFRADFAWPRQRLIVEINGGVFGGRAHGSVQGILMDMERGNLATLHGWRVLRFLPKDVTDEARRQAMIDLIRSVLGEMPDVLVKPGFAEAMRDPDALMESLLD